MPDMNKIKNHPGFMPFGHANTRVKDEDTQSSRDKEISHKEESSDASKGN